MGALKRFGGLTNDDVQLLYLCVLQGEVGSAIGYSTAKENLHHMQRVLLSKAASTVSDSPHEMC